MAKANHTTSTTNQNTIPISQLKQNPQITYKIHVLIYDLCNVAKDPASRKRLDATTDVQYLGSPYFSESESVAVKNAMVTIITTSTENSENLEDDAIPEDLGEDLAEIKVEAAQDSNTNTQPSNPPNPNMIETTVQKALETRFANFMNKRKASGDYRPCGPHDMGPVYMEVFGITKSDVEDESFLSRLRRSGLGDDQVVGKDQKGPGGTKDKSGRGKGKGR